MFDELKEKIKEIDEKISRPEVIADVLEYRKLSRERARFKELVDTHEKYREVSSELSEARELLEKENDREMIDFLETEILALEEKLEKIDSRLRDLLAPQDEFAGRNVIVEIRAGTGGNEAALFAADLYRMYVKYAERRGWKLESLSSNPSELGGFKEIVFSLNGSDVYMRMKGESGVHRVQRVPVTESGGRIHTSTATVAVLPEAEEVDVKIEPSDIKVDVFRSTGPGGQSVNTTDSAVRITHKPTGIVVTCQDEKSQLQNREKAMRILRARLLEQLRQEERKKQAEARKSQVGTGERSEKIRTYNFPQGRVTDHRIGLTIHKLDDVLEGELDEIIESLLEQERAEELKNIGLT
ncbi:MAG: peptide chain release factor 1 [Actinomycetota bacterium]|nr:peptide chain release factor 1 [Actinomycetota bacterium]